MQALQYDLGGQQGGVQIPGFVVDFDRMVVGDRFEAGPERRVCRCGRPVCVVFVGAAEVGGPVRVIHSRIIVVNVVLVLAAVLAFAASITIGDHPITLEKVFEVFMGGGTRLQRTVVLKWRLHRAVAAVAVGLALGLAGALTQSVTRNPLASPDVLGISQGASACAVTIIVLGSGTMGAVSLPVAALIGSTLAAVVIWLLGSRRGMDTFRLVLSGIMITALLQSYITWLLLRADISDAAIAKTWLTGSLVASSANRNLPVLLVLALIMPTIGYMAFQLRAMTLGDDMAAGLGVSVDKHKALFLLVSVVLTAVAVSAAGPIGFVAFVAPQLAMRLTGTPTPPLVGSALCGAALLAVADLVARAGLPVELPVGLVTSAIGGAFLVYLLIQTNRKSTV